MLDSSAHQSKSVEFRKIGEMITNNDIKVALQQPYFIDFEEDIAILKNFQGDQQINLSISNSKRLTDLDSFIFFKWNGLAIIVKRNAQGRGTTVSSDVFFDQQLCIIALQHEIRLPVSVYAENSGFLFMLCESTLFIFKDNLSFSIYTIDPPSLCIGGVEPRRLFLNAPFLFFSHDLPEKYRRRSEEWRNMKIIQGKQLTQTRQKLEKFKYPPFNNCLFVSRFAKEYDIKKILGSGVGGCVFEAMHNYDKWTYAVKRIAIDPENMEEALMEVRAMAQFDHVNIVRYNSTWVEEPPSGWQSVMDADTLKKSESDNVEMLNFKDNCLFIYIQMQLCNYSLSEWLKRNNTNESRKLKQVRLMFRQIVEGVEYLHKKNFIHRDLKPGNILFYDEDKLKICDMGIVVERKIVDGKEAITAHNEAGTNEYKSPEQRRCLPLLNAKSDVFTLGLIFAELCLVMEYEEKVKLFDSCREGNRNGQIIKDVHTDSFIQWMTQPIIENRPTCTEILGDPCMEIPRRHYEPSIDVQIDSPYSSRNSRSDTSDEEVVTSL